MAFQKGHKKLGGKPKGYKDKKTLMVEEIVARVGVDPLEVLLKFAAGDWEGLGYDSPVYHFESADKSTSMGYVITPAIRAQAAKEAAQYIYPKKREAEEVKEPEIDVTPENELEAAKDTLKYIESKYPQLLKKNE